MGQNLTTYFFAEDSLLFCRATIQEWNRLSGILEMYERASSQRLNKEKTAISFGSIFQLPKELCKDLNTLMQNFWWGHMENEKKNSLDGLGKIREIEITMRYGVLGFEVF
jgi:hypothetical protein